MIRNFFGLLMVLFLKMEENVIMNVNAGIRTIYNGEVRKNFGCSHFYQDSLTLEFEKMKLKVANLYCGKVRAWFQAMDLYDHGITEHTLRVTAISLELGRSMGFSLDELHYIQYGTLLHDIGKLGIPDEILQKPDKLTVEEFQVVKKHPIYANDWISNGDEFLPAKVIPLYHHEKWNGTGYPFGLKGTNIPLFARIVAVVDVWDAITSDRPYRRAMRKSKAMRLIQSEGGKQFDPDVVDAFIKLGVDKNFEISYENVLID